LLHAGVHGQRGGRVRRADPVRSSRRRSRELRGPRGHRSAASGGGARVHVLLALAGGRSAHGRVLRQAVRVRCGDRRGALHARGDRSAQQRGRRLLLPARHRLYVHARASAGCAHRDADALRLRRDRPRAGGAVRPRHRPPSGGVAPGGIARGSAHRGLMRSPRRSTSLLVAAGLAGLAVVGAGCSRKKEAGSGAPAASASALTAPVASGIPIPLEEVARAVNPKNEPAYSGPTATVRGVVRITGDPPHERSELLEQIPSDCVKARETYGPLFRKGPAGELADALVAVTEYPHYVPEKEPVRVVPARGCAWESRTIALTFGQRIEIDARDPRPYVPELLGGRMPAQLVALPGTRSALYPKQPGRY